MYEGLIVVNYGVFRRCKSGSVQTYNAKKRYVKRVEGLSEEECQKKIEQILADANFEEIANERSSG